MPQVRLRHDPRRLRALAAHRDARCSASATRRGCSRSTPPRTDYDARMRRAVRPARRRARARRERDRAPARGARRRAAGGRAHRDGCGAARPDRRTAGGCRAVPARRRRREPAWSRPAPSRRAPATSAPAPASSPWSCSSGPFTGIHHEIDLVTTPAGDPVAMVHCNNGASELAAWVGMFRRFAEVPARSLKADEVFDALFREALDGDPDAGGLLAYNHLAGEPIAGLTEGRPLFVRTPDSRFTLSNFMRGAAVRRVRDARPRHARARGPGRRDRPHVRARRHVPHRRCRAAIPRRRARTPRSPSARRRRRAEHGASRCSPHTPRRHPRSIWTATCASVVFGERRLRDGRSRSRGRPRLRGLPEPLQRRPRGRTRGRQGALTHPQAPRQETRRKLHDPLAPVHVS